MTLSKSDRVYQVKAQNKQARIKTMATREEHLKMTKGNALEYCDRGDISGAVASMAADFMKHPELKDHIGINLMLRMLMQGKLDTVEEMIHFINGFN